MVGQRERTLRGEDARPQRGVAVSTLDTQPWGLDCFGDRSVVRPPCLLLLSLFCLCCRETALDVSVSVVGDVLPGVAMLGPGGECGGPGVPACRCPPLKPPVAGTGRPAALLGPQPGPGVSRQASAPLTAGRP